MMGVCNGKRKWQLFYRLMNRKVHISECCFCVVVLNRGWIDLAWVGSSGGWPFLRRSTNVSSE